MREFGIKRENEERRDGGFGIIFHPQTQLYAVGREFSDDSFRFFGGGVDLTENIKEGVLREVVEESGLYNFMYVEKIGEVLAHYYNKPKDINRITKATCFLIILKNTDLIEVKLEKHEKFNLAWAKPDEIFKNLKLRNQNKDYDHWIYFLKKSVIRAKELGYDTTSVLEN